MSNKLFISLKKSKMNIAIIGSGYVGSITGLCLSQIGNQVRCIDINEKIVKNLNLGNLHFLKKAFKNY